MDAGGRRVAFGDIERLARPAEPKETPLNSPALEKVLGAVFLYELQRMKLAADVAHRNDQGFLIEPKANRGHVLAYKVRVSGRCLLTVIPNPRRATLGAR